MDDSGENLLGWLVRKCGVSSVKAEGFCEVLENDGIDNLTQLRICMNQDPNYLSSTTIPRMIQMTIKSRIMEMDHSKLDSLTTTEISALMNNVFPDNPEYADAFFRSGVNGFVLNAPVSSGQLMEWGGLTAIHAGALEFHLPQWRTNGVHHSKIDTSRFANVKKEQVKSDPAGVPQNEVWVKRFHCAYYRVPNFTFLTGYSERPARSARSSTEGNRLAPTQCSARSSQGTFFDVADCSCSREPR